MQQPTLFDFTSPGAPKRDPLDPDSEVLLDEYAERYETIRMERRDGILQMTFHTEGGPLQWGELPHSECPRAFRDIGGDPDNKVVIMTGTGEAFSGPQATPGARLRN